MMTREELLSMAFAAGFSVRGETIRTIHSSGAWVGINDKLMRFAELATEKERASRQEAQLRIEDLQAHLVRADAERCKAVAAERERLCALIKAADDKASEGDYMLDSDDCISVIKGTWNHEHN